MRKYLFVNDSIDSYEGRYIEWEKKDVLQGSWIPPRGFKSLNVCFICSPRDRLRFMQGDRSLKWYFAKGHAYLCELPDDYGPYLYRPVMYITDEKSLEKYAEYFDGAVHVESEWKVIER